MKHKLTKEQKGYFDRLIKAVEEGISYKDEPVFFDIETWLDRGPYMDIAKDADDQVYKGSECGTVACIHGHALIEFETIPGVAASVGVNGGIKRRQAVAELLGVPSHEYTNLCLGPVDIESRGLLVTRKHAVEAIKYLRDNGRMSEMVWTAIVNKEATEWAE